MIKKKPLTPWAVYAGWSNSKLRIVKQNHIISFVIPLFFSFVTMAFISESVFAEEKIPVTTETDGGLHTITFETPEGEIKIYLPDDMAAGDTISGTVVAEPSGTNEEERRENSDELNGYVVEIESKEKQFGETKVSSGKLQEVSIPKDLSGGPAKITLSNSKGQEVIVSEMPIQDSPHPIIYATPPSSEDFKLPYIGQSGEPVEVIGPFDGAFDTTTVKIGGRKADILAESPRKVIARMPGDIAGSTEIQVIEKGVKVRGAINIVDVTIPAAKESLEGIWRSKSGKSTWRISQDGQKISADSVLVSKEDQTRGYRPNVNAIRGRLQGNLLVGQIQQFFLIPLEECMAMCPSQCEQWNELKLILSEDGKTLKGQIQEKAINTESCIVIEFGWRPWTMSK